MGQCLPCLPSVASAGPSPEEREAATKALIAASKGKDAAKCAAALQSGADVNVANTDFFNYTALHLFASVGDLPTVALLISKGAQVDPRSSTEETPLLMAARSKHRQVCDFLLEAGADKDAHTNYAQKTAKMFMDEI
mmetsp:Transcript_77981/g.137433  ORF Transcript_77981/g.137433 Transcript_77981/m.137433 type:complete len:137 (-) Transcript_77981:121-531(-)